uniref:Uncharacterized protein n=1 Tax=Parascaris univalens TaxID=6257 RepID=A0A915ABK1_PARUN
MQTEQKFSGILWKVQKIFTFLDNIIIKSLQCLSRHNIAMI